MGNQVRETAFAFKTCQRIAVTSTAAVLSTQTNDHIQTYRIVPSSDVFADWGSSTIVAASSAGTTSAFFPSGNEYLINTNQRFFSFDVISTSTGLFVNLCELTQGD